MSHHVLAFSGAGGAGAYATIPAISDIYNIQNSDFILHEDVNLYAAYVQGTVVDHVRLNVPSLNTLFLPQIRPINVGATVPTNPGVDLFYPQPIKIPGDQEIRIEGANSSTTVAITCGLFVAASLDPLPQGPRFVLRGTAATTLVASTWTQLTTTWDTTPPPGQYSVVGLTVFSATGVFARCIIPGQFKRPGSVCVNAMGSAVNRFFDVPNLGSWGIVRSVQLPVIEVFALAADTAETVFLELIKVG